MSSIRKETDRHVLESWDHYPLSIRAEAREFDMLCRIWRKDNPIKQVNFIPDYDHYAYKELLSGGTKYLPFVLDCLEGKPKDDIWYHFLNITLSGYPKEVKGNPTHAEIAKAWKNFCLERGFLSATEIKLLQDNWRESGINEGWGTLVADKAYTALLPVYNQLKQIGAFSNVRDFEDLNYILDTVATTLTFSDRVSFTNEKIKKGI